MSATLTWFNSGYATKTGTALADLINDIKTLVDSKSADANFSWQSASVSVAGTVNYLVLKPKSGAAGRILLVGYTSAPAGNNAALFGSAPGTTAIYLAFFPAGNVDTPSNLSAASGTVMGDDTGAPRAVPIIITTIYATGMSAFYFESAEAVVFGFSGGANTFAFGAGNLLIDSADAAYPAALTTCNATLGGFGISLFGYSVTDPASSSNTPVIRGFYGGARKVLFAAFWQTGWASALTNADTLLQDATTNNAWFLPYPLIMRAEKGVGFPLKLRQIGIGPYTSSAFEARTETGPVVKARQFCGVAAGDAQSPWFTNFKL